MFMAAEPWPIVTAVMERELASFGPPQPASAPAPDAWMARLGELPRPGLRRVGTGRRPLHLGGRPGTAWSNGPARDLTVVVLTQRAADETGMPAVCDEVLAAARAAV
jgi:hypothetical protein